MKNPRIYEHLTDLNTLGSFQRSRLYWYRPKYNEYNINTHRCVSKLISLRAILSRLSIVVVSQHYGGMSRLSVASLLDYATLCAAGRQVARPGLLVPVTALRASCIVRVLPGALSPETSMIFIGYNLKW